MMIFLKRGQAMFRALSALLLLLCTISPAIAQDATDAPAPFIAYNATLQVGTSGLVIWDKNALSGNVSLWIQENYPNSSVARIPLDLNTNKGSMLWEVGTNVPVGEYYYEIQLISGTGIVYKSNPFSVICASCPLPTSSAAAASSTVSSSVSHLSYSTTYPTSGPTSAAAPSTPTSTSTPTATPAATHSGVSSGVAAGIGVAGAAAVAIVAILFWLFSRRRRRRNQQTPPPAPYTQPWTPPPPQQHPDMTTYASVPPYKPPTHNRQLSHELQSSEVAPTSPPSESNRSHLYSPPRSPPLQQHQTNDPRFGQPQPHHVQQNQPWMQAGGDGAGSPQMSYEGSENMHNSPESQQGLFPPRNF